jgi:hypothetical protein
VYQWPIFFVSQYCGASHTRRTLLHLREPAGVSAFPIARATATTTQPERITESIAKPIAEPIAESIAEPIAEPNRLPEPKLSFAFSERSADYLP